MTISKKVTGGYGFSVRGSKPVRISSVRENDDVSHTQLPKTLTLILLEILILIYSIVERPCGW